MANSNAGAPRRYTEADFTDFDHTGPDTLAGRYMRRFWHPVFLSEELPPGWAVPITLMSERFTLYRGESGVPHLVEFACAHRGTQLSTGWVEDDCIRCRYHGWKYDGSGQCVEQPTEDPAFAARVRLSSYPVEEYLGAIFVYIGEGDPPPLPRYARMEQPGILEWEVAPRACNFFQEMENDPLHGSFVHRNPRLPQGVFEVPDISVEESAWGITWHRRYPTGDWLSQRGMPNLRHDLVRPRDGQGPWHNVFRWKVPIDDEHHTSFTVELVPVTGEAAERYRAARAAYFAKGGKVTDDEVVDAILAGKLRLDDVQRERWDLDMVRVQDDVTQIGQGAIRDRSHERLGRADGHLLLLRAQWARELRALAEGRPLKQWYLPDDLVCSVGPMRNRDVVGMVVEKA